ncbi:hypothetical protein Cp29156_1152 [Corynebacterium pseudotuberculosis]|uniref:hypothetical protein n=1 Tax=Corynebacterium pseudotuberculosis TaxID=1719 RepID=UPI0001E5F236|nr:hypothetical protein [Corynebacterium pseudotuberculosis]ADO26452.1 hypothetical protein CPI19_05575 [Corynebacterium pseudotuberculosis I19]AKI59543.1 hypothetical protein Cp29156_1152 [Corynebacterium pseudotuberculosis]
MKKLIPSSALVSLLLWVLWVASRVTLVRLVLQETSPVGDVKYYFVGVFRLVPGALKEYPEVGTWPINLLGWITGSNLEHFIIGFVIMCLLVDALFYAFLVTSRWRGRTIAALYWCAFGLATMQVFILRLDIVPGVLVGLAALSLFSHPYVASWILAFATSMKLWPGVLAAGLVGKFSSGKSWLRLLSFAVALLAFGSIVYIQGGWERLLSPLTYQSDRGLQIESLPATLFMYRAITSPEDYEVFYAASKSFEIIGPGVETAASISTWLMGATVVFVLLWALKHFLFGTWRAYPTLCWSIAVALLLIVTNKVLSPQYIIWVGPLVAIALLVRPKSVFAVIEALIMVALAYFSWQVYPQNYPSIMQVPFDHTDGVNALVIRNVLYLVATAVALVWAIRASVVDHDPTLPTERSFQALPKTFPELKEESSSIENPSLLSMQEPPVQSPILQPEHTQPCAIKQATDWAAQAPRIVSDQSTHSGQPSSFTSGMQKK